MHALHCERMHSVVGTSSSLVCERMHAVVGTSCFLVCKRMHALVGTSSSLVCERMHSVVGTSSTSLVCELRHERLLVHTIVLCEDSPQNYTLESFFQLTD
jgi:hypothetical protein